MKRERKVGKKRGTGSGKGEVHLTAASTRRSNDEGTCEHDGAGRRGCFGRRRHRSDVTRRCSTDLTPVERSVADLEELVR
ncbi:proline-rich receptor-like protein kinase PERK12 [Iris pallida]|uniref:Proline-rich receptor-like protein kinase PERK12 n=1 Tax=Iris pallida TaxID=29817 RepID=A0AAX6IEK6_IRIPA|nr:proline-rich receptor-like protein kinase PERK12 [Iris pallida]